MMRRSAFTVQSVISSRGHRRGVTLFLQNLANMSAMAVNKRGRPSRGSRDLVWGRIPSEHHDAIAQLMADRKAYKSDVVAALIAVGLRHMDEATLPGAGQQAELPLSHEELPLTRAS